MSRSVHYFFPNEMVVLCYNKEKETLLKYNGVVQVKIPAPRNF